ncbi:MAG: zinc ribbon domain-containing protein, partial [Candidatus Bathyarchaeia archaeon]
PPIPSGELIEVTYIGPSGERIVHHTPIKGGGDFEDALPSAAPGTWSGVAEWRGSPEYAPAKSPQASVTVEAKPTPASSILQDPMFIAVIILAAVIIGLAAALMKRKKGVPPARPAQALTRYCVNCGAELKPGKPFCSSCGERVE